MSMLVGYISKDSILMASDTRSCINFEGEYQVINDTTEKLFILDKSSMLFGCGSLHVIKNLAERLIKENIRNINKITQIAKRLVSDYLISGGIADKNGCVQIFYAQIVDGTPYVFITSDCIGWKIVSQKGEDNPIPFFGGYGSEIASKEYHKNPEKSQSNFISTTRKLFNLASSVHVGGALKVATLSTEGIATQEFPICDIGKNIKWLDKDNLILKFATATGGSMQLGGTHVTESMFRTDNGRGSNFFNSNFDASNNIHGGAVQVGTLNANSIMANSITANQIQAGAITANALAANSVLAQHISAGAVTADKINVNQLSAISANMGTITAGTITANCTINVSTDINVGAWINLASAWRGGIRQGDAVLEFDPAGRAASFNGPVHSQGLFVNNQPVATEAWVLEQLAALSTTVD